MFALAGYYVSSQQFFFMAGGLLLLIGGYALERGRRKVTGQIGGGQAS